MKERKDRKKSKKAEQLKEELKNVAPGSAEEAEILDSLEQLKSRDTKREEATLMDALATVDAEQEETKRKQVS